MNLHVASRILLSYHERRTSPDKPYPEYKSIIDARETVLAKFHPAFTLENIDDLSEATFRDFLAFEHNQHWTGLQRPTKHVCEDMPKLRQSIKRLLDENLTIEGRIDSVMQGGEFHVPGLAVGILSPILLISNPQKYGVWNGKSESALKLLNLWPDFPRGTTIGQKYSTLNAVLQDLSRSTGLDFWSIDGLWHVLNLVSQTGLEQALADEELEIREFFDGKKLETSGYRYERDPKARKECLKRYEAKCYVCDFDFFRTYGELGLGYIHVHHRTDLAVTGETSIDPYKDLVPVCPNCHTMLHKGASPARSVESLQKIMSDWAAEYDEDSGDEKPL
ncbi:MAG: HNH endonuclease [Planctomycetaceae bacterium]